MSKDSKFTLRFSIGDPNGLQSGEWRIWSESGKSDVYLAIRAIGGIHKISLHASGVCNSSITRQFAEAQSNLVSPETGSRHLDQWVRPVNSGPLLSIPLRLRFPSTELRPGMGSRLKEKEKTWVSPPPSGHTLDVICNFTSQPFPSGQWPWCDDGGSLLGSTDLPNGETLWLVSRIYLTPPTLLSHIEQQRKRASLPPGTRLLIGETGPGNVRIITDAASSLHRANNEH